MSVNTDTYTGPSFSLFNRITRFLWAFTYFLLFRFSPKPLHTWRVFILRIFGATIGKGVHIDPSVKIWAPWNLTVKDQVGIGREVILYSQGEIYLGRRSIVSQYAHLCTGTHDYNTKGNPLITKPIVIEDYAWIATDAFIHPGVTVHEGTIVGARSVVITDLPRWSICGGFPCIFLKSRTKQGTT
jgi:putative colanic acid biosynthesis acetyltransferase WcaF